MRERERETICVLVHVPGGHNGRAGPHWFQESGAASGFPTWVAGLQTLGPPSAAFSRPWQGAGSDVVERGHESELSISRWYTTSWLLLPGLFWDHKIQEEDVVTYLLLFIQNKQMGVCCHPSHNNVFISQQIERNAIRQKRGRRYL